MDFPPNGRTAPKESGNTSVNSPVSQTENYSVQPSPPVPRESESGDMARVLAAAARNFATATHRQCELFLCITHKRKR